MIAARKVGLPPVAAAARGGLVCFGSNMYALDAATGKILWKFPSGGSVIAGAVISDGVVY
ncbi:MAG: hypothetical protein JWM91_48 [Rhodospirillales bacterium]|nr:hypothetical protein [Rhodospirillales bacterium]